VEIGASIYHVINHNVAGFVKEFNLTKAKPFQNDSAMAIWDGTKFVHSESSIPFIGEFIDIASVLWRYGLSPIYFKNAVAALLLEWEVLYDILEPFYTTGELFEKINLYNMTQATAPDYLASNIGVSREFTREMLGALTRVNYNTDVAKMNTFAVLVSAVGSGKDLFTVAEGNKVICEKLLESAKAKIVLSTPISSVNKAEEPLTSYQVNGEDYDVVVIAAPLELAGVEFPNIEIDEYVFRAREYQEVHVTFVATIDLRPSYFQLAEVVPEVVLTIEDASVPFSSVAKLANITMADGRPVYKVFSRTALSSDLLERLFRNGTVVNKKVIKAYPVLTPQKEVPITLAEKLFYVNSFESVVSTMETETISGKNVAKLAAKALGYPVKKI
jgi:prenylcysteine oxidase/farnesylcysteine lyase